MQILVSDTSVLIDLERGKLLEATFQLPFEFSVPDLLYKKELRDNNGELLQSLGLKIASLDGKGVERAMRYKGEVNNLSLPDCFALSFAKSGSHTLLAGDLLLRKTAKKEKVEYHGVLWILDKIQEHKTATLNQLLDGLTAIQNHPRCRLPQKEILSRLKKYNDSTTSK